MKKTAKRFRGAKRMGRLMTSREVIQIKPQLEKLLNLPDDSLTKELRAASIRLRASCCDTREPLKVMRP